MCIMNIYLQINTSIVVFLYVCVYYCNVTILCKGCTIELYNDICKRKLHIQINSSPVTVAHK